MRFGRVLQIRKEQHGLVEYGRTATFTGLQQADVRWLIVIFDVNGHVYHADFSTGDGIR